jgi:signal transduction histidine kinase
MSLSPFRKHRLSWDFALGALVVTLLVGGALAYLGHAMTMAQLERMAERNNAALTQAISNWTWPRFRDFIAEARYRSPEELRYDPRTPALHDEIVSLIKGTDVLKVKIYDFSGVTAFSTEAAQVGTDYGTRPGFLAGRNGGVFSELEYREHFAAIGGRLSAIWVLSSYVPIRAGGPDSPVEAVAEIYSDVTAIHAYVRDNANLVVILVGCGLLIVFTVLFVLVRRAERRMERIHQHNLELNSAQARAEAASQAKSTFLANMSHELRTPLNAVIGFAGLIRDAPYGPLGDSRYREHAADIHGAGTHLLKVINDVLDYVKIEAGKMPVATAPVELRAVAESALSMVQAQALEAEVALALAPGMPVRIESDETKIRQILLNLLSNALKFTPAGGSVTIEVGATQAGEQAYVAVADTGIGIREEDIPVAFAPFGQSLGRANGGTGLGLPLSREFAVLLGGTLTLESKPGSGTRVAVTLPRRRAAGRRPLIRASAA